MVIMERCKLTAVTEQNITDEEKSAAGPGTSSRSRYRERVGALTQPLLPSCLQPPSSLLPSCVAGKRAAIPVGQAWGEAPCLPTPHVVLVGCTSVWVCP